MTASLPWLGILKILIFPHLGTFSSPQGRETKLTQVQVTSTAPCVGQAARLNPQGQWEPDPRRSPLTIEKNSTSFTLEVTIPLLKKGPLLFTCEKAFRVHREAPLLSYVYEGSFVAYAEKNRVHLVNLVDMEAYIRGVVPSEMPASWPIEALKAQAVAARTYAAHDVLRSRAELKKFDLDDTISSQVYLGLEKQEPSTRQAVAETQNQILEHEGKPIRAYFSADAGGFTESAEAVFGSPLPYAIAQPEAIDISSNPRSQWTAEIKWIQVTQALRGRKLIPAEATVISLDVAARTSSHRVGMLSVRLNTGATVQIRGTDFRHALKLRSTAFEIMSSHSSEIHLKGKGHGHGVGLSQWGAHLHHVQRGWKYDQILNFYYPGALKKLL